MLSGRSIRPVHRLDAVAQRALHALILGLVLVVLLLVAVPLADRYSPSHENALVIAVLLVLVIEFATGLVDRLVEWLLFGKRADAAAASWQLAKGLEELDDEEAVIGLAHSLVDTLRLSFLEVVIEKSGQITTLVTIGEDSTGATPFPITHAGVDTGYVSARRRRTPLDARDERLLHAAAAQLGVVLRAKDLADELQAARRELVISREDERRRLRRELHDGVGPTLAGIGLGLQAVDNALPADVPRARSLLTTVQVDITELIDDVRRVVDNLRPPLLDEVGLPGALTQRAKAFAAAAEWTLDVRVDELPPLPAAVEVAAFRIGSEALTNVARHAEATHCQLWLRIDGDFLLLDVCDDGHGEVAPGRGTGIASMQNRAAELGGSVLVASVDSGTTVQMQLPLTVDGAHE